MRHSLLDSPFPEHVALGYSARAPISAAGKVPEGERERWLEELSSVIVSPDYRVAFERWRSSLCRPGDVRALLTMQKRLLVGHGNSSASDVGLTVHHTWGVPMIPGSALKGLLSHYVEATYGPDDPSAASWWDQDQIDRAQFQGPTWDVASRRILGGPGALHRALFGSPDAEDDELARHQGLRAGACAGLVVFHDALYVPSSTTPDRPFVSDVLTVHHKRYYDDSGATWPNDYDSPVPVGFITARPGIQLLVALSGPSAWTELALHLLTDALGEWGVGGKTSSGYGIGSVEKKTLPVGHGSADAASATEVSPLSSSLSLFIEEVRTLTPTGGAGLKQWEFLVYVENRWMEELLRLERGERTSAAAELQRKIKSAAKKERIKNKLEEILRLLG